MMSRIAVMIVLFIFSPSVFAAGESNRGEYVFRLSGCDSCHTDSKKSSPPLAGGMKLASPFGDFFVPNITPDPDTGIGRWSDSDFIQAMTEGIAPDGSHYYPAFPYTSYTRMTPQDLLDLKAYLNTVKPIRNEVPPHNMHFPFNVRTALGIWKWMFFQPGPFAPDLKKDPILNRGAYIVTGPGHCGECHTTRNFLGRMDQEHLLAGAKKGPDGKPVPNITPHEKNGIGNWSISDLVYFLKEGITAFGDTVDYPMDEVIDNNTSHWTEADRTAVATYLLSLPKLKTP